MLTTDNGVVLASDVLTFGEDIFVISIDASWAITNPTVGEGPLEVGWAHGDLTVAEIAEALDAEVTDPDDIIAGERARRPVRRVGKFACLLSDEVLFNGRVERQLMKISIGDSHTLKMWGRNRSGAIFANGPSIQVDGVIYGRWQR